MLIDSYYMSYFSVPQTLAPIAGVSAWRDPQGRQLASSLPQALAPTAGVLAWRGLYRCQPAVQLSQVLAPTAGVPQGVACLDSPQTLSQPCEGDADEGGPDPNGEHRKQQGL